MSAGAQVNVISAQLVELLGQVRQETLKVIGRGKRPDPADPATAVYFGKLDSWKHRLEDLRHQLERLQSNIEGQRAFAPPVPRGATGEMRRSAAYRATQSLNDKSLHIQGALDLAEQVSAALADLLLLSVTPTKTDVEKSVSDLAKQPIDFLHKLEDMSKTIEQTERAGTLDHHVAGQLRSAIGQIRGPEIIGPVAGTPSPDYLGVATLMLTLLRVWWLERIRQQKQAP